MRLDNINKTYHNKLNDVHILKDLNFTLNTVGLTFIIGKSGSGKTTLLNIIAGYEDFDGGKRLIKKGTKIAYIFQTYELINNLTVAENIDLFENLYHIKELRLLIFFKLMS